MRKKIKEKMSLAKPPKAKLKRKLSSEPFKKSRYHCGWCGEIGHTIVTCSVRPAGTTRWHE